MLKRAVAILLLVLLAGCGKNPYVPRVRATLPLVTLRPQTSTPYVTATSSLTPTPNVEQIIRTRHSEAQILTWTAAWTPSPPPNINETVHAELTRLMRDAQTATAYRFPYTETAVPSATRSASDLPLFTPTPTRTLIPLPTAMPTPTHHLLPNTPSSAGSLGSEAIMQTATAVARIFQAATTTALAHGTPARNYAYPVYPQDIARATFDAVMRATWDAWTPTYTPDMSQTVSAGLTAMEQNAQTATANVLPRPYATLDFQPIVPRRASASTPTADEIGWNKP